MNILARVTKVNNEDSRIRGYASITVENCCKLNGIRIFETQDGELFASYPQKAVYENGQPKLDENGKQVYTDVYFAISKEANDAIKAVCVEAYKSEEGYAFINPKPGEPTRATIEPQLHACNDERVKASGSLKIGTYIIVPDVFINLAGKEGEKFLSVSYPHYKSGDEYKDFVAPLEKGAIWDRENEVEVEYDFKHKVEGAMVKKTLEFHPELAEVLKAQKSVDEKIADAKAVADGANGAKGMEPEMEPAK